jgi:hypothetical protein
MYCLNKGVMEIEAIEPDGLLRIKAKLAFI